MRFDFAPIAGGLGDRNRFRTSEAAAQWFRTGLGKRLRRPLMLALPMAVAVVGAFIYLAQEQYVSTDDAFVRAAKVTINARVSGQAVEIAVRDNQRVRRGQVLFRIDAEPYEIAVDQAEARLGSTRLQIESLKATHRQQQAELQSAKESAAFDEREFDRKKMLVASDFTPRAVYERAETDMKVARHRMASIEQQIANTIVALNGDVDAYPDRKFRAHIVSMSPGTGSDFSILPAENATGNWVKVVQRLPVRL